MKKNSNDTIHKKKTLKIKATKTNIVLDNLLVFLYFFQLIIIFRYFIHYDITSLYILSGLIITVASSIYLIKKIARISGAYISFHYLKYQKNPLKKKTTMKKWIDQSWQLSIHIIMTLFELIVLMNETWWQDTKSLWNKKSKDCIFPEHKMLSRILYLTQMAIWIYTAFSCKFLEEKRKDYLVMMSHHVVTLALVTGSYMSGYLPIGIIILFLHDVSDIPLDMLKMTNYLKLEGKKGYFLVEFFFILVVLSWMYFRITLYPIKLINATLFESRAACKTNDTENRYNFLNFYPGSGPPYWVVFNILLLALYCLHVWWGFLILRLLFGVMKKGMHKTGTDEYEGTSSESESEDSINNNNKLKDQ